MKVEEGDDFCERGYPHRRRGVQDEKKHCRSQGKNSPETKKGTLPEIPKGSTKKGPGAKQAGKRKSPSVEGGYYMTGSLLGPEKFGIRKKRYGEKTTT